MHPRQKRIKRIKAKKAALEQQSKSLEVENESKLIEESAEEKVETVTSAPSETTEETIVVKPIKKNNKRKDLDPIDL